MYEGGHIGQGRLCRISLRPPDASDGGGGGGGDDALLPAAAVMRALRDDGVDLDAFYATAYESMASGGGWMPLEPAPRHRNPWNDGDGAAAVAAADVDDDDDCGAGRRTTATGPSSSSSSSSLVFPIPPREGDGGGSAPRRIDVKLFRRPKVPTIRGSGVAGEGVGDDRWSTRPTPWARCPHPSRAARSPWTGTSGSG